MATMSQVLGEERLRGSAQLWDRAKLSLGGGVSTGVRMHMPPHPIFFDRGAGSHLWDVDGNELIDYVLGWGPLIVGHCNARLVAAVKDQLDRGTTFGSGHRLEYEAAEAVRAAMPWVERLLWSNTGSEAVQSALRLARATTGRQKILKFEGHYHGWMDSVLASYRAVTSDHATTFESLGQTPSSLSDVITLPWNDENAFTATMESHGDEIAAVITEPVLCNSGVIEAAPGFLQLLRRTTQDRGSLLIFDEVITGFRVARGGATERYGVRPDLHTLGKALAGGFSASAVAGRADIIDRVAEGVVHAGTYNGNPLVLAGVQATLQELAGDGVFDRLEEAGRALADGFRDILRRRGARFAVNQVGPVAQIGLGIDSLDSFAQFIRADWSTYDRLVVALLGHGVFALPGGRWYLSTAHTPADIDATVAAFADAVREVL